MKTAEKWSKELGEHTEYPYDLQEGREYPNVAIEQIQQIQLDAMKEGYMLGVQDTKNKSTTDLNEFIK